MKIERDVAPDDLMKYFNVKKYSQNTMVEKKLINSFIQNNKDVLTQIRTSLNQGISSINKNYKSP